MSRSISVAAPAKINLTLEVLGRRDDGFHEVRSVMATLDLADRVRVSPARDLAVRITPPLGIPPNRDLCALAVRALAGSLGREPRARVDVRKRIAVAAGLGGGSSDAAATLRALAALWRSDADLVRVAAIVGSDVPFFAAAAPFARVSGRGEQVRPLPAPAVPVWIALVRLPVRVATADVFAALRAAERSDGDASAALAVALERGAADATTLRERATNDLVRAAERVCHAIAVARKAASDEEVTLHLSGSGPSLFAIADDRADALRVARMLRRIGLRARAHVLG